MTDTEDLYRLLRTDHLRAQGIVDTIPDPLLVLNGDLCVQSASLSFFETFKVSGDDTIGRPFYELGDGQWDIPELRSLLSDVIPKAKAVIDFEVTHDFPGLGRRTMLVTARKLHNNDKAGRSILLSIVDATDRYRRDAEQTVLFGELRHRMKNLLGVVQSIARQTASEGRTADEYRNDLLGRLDALAEAQKIVLSEQNDCQLRDLCGRLLAPYAARADAIAIEPGPPVELDGAGIQSLSLLVHELATNAAKYWALSAPGGQVRISWRIDEADHALHVSWAESGGPRVAPPVQTGFGTRLMQSFSASGGGRVATTYAPGGVEAEIAIPLERGVRH